MKPATTVTLLVVLCVTQCLATAECSPLSVAERGPRCRKTTPITWPSELPKIGPKTITTFQELNRLDVWVAPILYGGLGNEMFQLAALEVYCKEINVTCVIGWFQHWNRKISNSFEPWGGHPAPAPGMTLKHIYPALRYMTVVPKATYDTVINHYAFSLSHPGEYFPMPDKSRLPAQIHGYFFNTKYFHHERQFILDLFKLHPLLEQYVQENYADLISGEKETVSLHLRFGYGGEPATALLEERRFPPKAFYNEVFTRIFPKNKVKYVVFADNIDRARQFMSPLADAGFDFEMIDESSVISVRLMSLCKHHVLTSSTLSFWGAYLDEMQPKGGRTILHTTFFRDHGQDVVPYDEWEVYDQ